MKALAYFRINYKSDFILTLHSDAGWMTPFCIKFWTGAPSQAYYVGWDGTTYTHCSYDPSEPTKLLVQFDDHHLPIGDLKFQIAYHFTGVDFPNDVEDEVLNQSNIVTEIDGNAYQVMLDFTGETAPEIQFSLPAYANEAQRIANEEQRIAHEAIRIVNEESRIAAETIRQQNEAQRIAQETARVNEFATLKSQSQAATSAANTAAALANEKAALAADKAALAGAAATLANAKAQLAADKAALADAAATLANDKAALAQQKAEYAQQQGGYAKDQGDYAKNQGDYAKEQGDTALADHQRAEADHGIAVDDHTQAGNDHTRAEADHGISVDDHTQAGNDHTRAESDHGIAADDHTQAGNDHTRAESDHTRAESDHAAVEVYVDSLGAFDISAYHATGGVLAKYADLTAALGTNGANIPDALRKGGMSVKYVRTSDNKYVQARCMAQNFTTDVTQWQGMDDEPTAGSNNLVKSGGVRNQISPLEDAYRPQNYTAGKSINSSGSIVDNIYWGFSDYIELGYFTSLIAHFGQAHGASAVIAFYNAQKEMLDAKYSNSIDRTINKTDIAGYANIKYCRISFLISYDKAGIEINNMYIWQPKKDGIIKKMQDSSNKVEHTVSLLSDVQNYTVGKRINSTGDFVDDEDWGISDYIELGYFTSLIAHFGQAAGANANIVFYTNNKNIIDSKQASSIDRTIEITSINSYTQVKYCRISFLLSYSDAGVEIDNEYIWKPKVDGTIKRLQDKVEQIITVQNYTPNYKINSGGIINYDTNWCLSNKIDLGSFTSITVHFGEAAMYSSVILFYDENGVILDYKISNASDRTITKTDIAKNNRIKYCVFSYRKGYASAGIELDGVYVWKPIEAGYAEQITASLMGGGDIYSKNKDKLDILRASSNNSRRLQLLVATDAHKDWVALRNAVDFANKCPYIDALLLPGDNCGEAGPSLEVFENYNNIVNICNKPVLSIPGNHDAGYDRRLRLTATNDKICQYITQPSIRHLGSGEYETGKTYFFHDFASKKTRIICLNDFDEDIQLVENSNWQAIEYNASYNSFALNTEYAVNDCVNFGLYTANSFKCLVAHTSSADNEIRTTGYRGYRFIGETQMNWLVSTMLSTPADYSLIICTHVPASNDFSTMYRNNKFCSKYLSENTSFNAFDSDVLGKLVDDFNKGQASSILVKGKGTFTYLNTQTIDGESCAYKVQYDFSNKNIGAKFLVFCCGHTHVDMIMKNSLGSYSISPTYTTATTRQFGTNDVPRSVDDTQIARDALTAIAFDYDHDGVILTRVGTTSTTDGYLRDVDRLDLTQ